MSVSLLLVHRNGHVVVGNGDIYLGATCKRPIQTFRYEDMLCYSVCEVEIQQ